MTSLSSLNIIAALAAVLGLIWLIQQAVRLGWLPLPRQAMTRGNRIRIVEVHALDSRRRLHLVACDGREYLLLTGGPNDLTLPFGEAS